MFILALKHLILNSCKSGEIIHFRYPKDKYKDIDFISLLEEMESENLISILGFPKTKTCDIQITDYGLLFLE